ncbi:unnamed protein product [Victoria cruziana]
MAVDIPAISTSISSMGVAATTIHSTIIAPIPNTIFQMKNGAELVPIDPERQMPWPASPIVRKRSLIDRDRIRCINLEFRPFFPSLAPFKRSVVPDGKPPTRRM